MASTQSLSASAIRTTSSMESPHPALSASASDLSAGQPSADAADVDFHAEPQGLMQMLSLVGSTFFEADREGFTEDDARKRTVPATCKASLS